MSACTCAGLSPRVKRRLWIVTAYRCNYSAFNGYRRAPSTYSEVRCRRCRSRWRTRAAYVDALPRATTAD